MLIRLLVRRGLSILQISTREDRVSFLVLELQHSRLAYGLDGLVGVLYAGQLYYDPTLALTLDYRLRQAQLIDTFFHDFYHALHGIVIYLSLWGVFSFQHHMGSTLQVQSLSNAVCQWMHECNEDSSYDYNTGNQLDETISSQLFQILSLGMFP